MTDPFVGKLTYFRVYTGTLKSGSYVYNSVSDRKERISRILRMHANTREDVEEAYAGDIVAAVGLKHTRTGDTLCDESDPIILEKMTFPDPVIHVAIEPKTKADQDKLGEAHHEARRGRSRRSASPRTRRRGRRSSAGWGSLHLEIIIDRMKREFRVEANIGKPQVAYKETIRKKVEAEGKFVRQSGGRGQYGHVWIEMEPNEKGKGFEFENGDRRRRHPEGVHQAGRAGDRRGDEERRPRRISGGRHQGHVCSTDRSTMWIRRRWRSRWPGRWPSRRRARKADPVLLEPIMEVEVVTPEEYMGDVMGDLNSRRGKIEGMTPRKDAQVIRAAVPLSEMFGYSTTLRSMTQGRAIYTMELSHYDEAAEERCRPDHREGQGQRGRRRDRHRRR